MHPFKNGELYPLNQWYVAAWSGEVTRDLLARTICGKSVVMYRTEQGAAVALDNRCPHRALPLSMGKLIGDVVQCRYHGFEFDCTGKCVAIPSQADIPESYGVRTFPLHETWQWLWIWMGDPALADASLIPDGKLIHTHDPDWYPEKGGLVHLKCRYQLLNENLLDLSHLSFLHSHSVGSPGLAKAPVSLKDKGRYLEVFRNARSDDLEGLGFAKALGIRGPVDRKQTQLFFAPGFHATGGDYDSAEADGIDPGHHFGAMRVLHGVTPETPNTTLYFWGFTRDFQPGQAMTEALHHSIGEALVEDQEGLEAVEQMLAGSVNVGEISCKADAAAFRGRLLVQRQIEAEQRTPMPVPDKPRLAETVMTAR